MKILAFESSAKAAGVALLEDGVLLAESFQNTALTHSRTLMQMAEDMLRNCELSANDVDAVAVAAGPGSFTGVRIGVAAAKGFAWGRELPCCGVSTLEAMVLGAAMCDGVYCACMDARREQFYNAVFAVTNGKLERMSEDRAISAEDLREELKKIEKTVFLVGDGAALCYNLLSEGLPQLRLVPEHLRQQRASGVALMAYQRLQSGEACSADELTPNYLRLSQAERERAEKQIKESR
ncbi:MAG: tRNA (adenosine(37)-N6)-threonylcarbamoyltransferase complex dimerization subunit type 1 TsaB [Oscillospiraceae bacterium]|nr:tRNA (adenosine(37)-N6)-threonylcarbamoyltransferase complex dimerization subunit type 1 TsaB [Oscillospiraceae bacterium]